MLQKFFQFGHEHLPDELAVVNQAVLRRDENQLDGLERLGHGDRDAVGIHAIRLAVAVETERRNDGHDALREQRLEQLGVHALDLAGEQMIHALNDAHRMRDDGVGAGGAEVVGRKAFENFVREPVGGGERELERGRVGDARAVEVGRLDVLLLGERLDLRRRAVDEHDADVQRAQHRDVQQERWRSFRR